MSLLLVALFLAAPVPKTAPEPEWMKEFRKTYELKDGEHVKRVAAPFIKERFDFYNDNYDAKKDPAVLAEARKSYLQYEKWWQIYVDQDGTKLTRRHTISWVGLAHQPANQRGDLLLDVAKATNYITGLYEPECIIDPKHKDHELFNENNRKVNGDFVVRKDAPLDKLASQLETIFREQCDANVRLKVIEEERTVYVVSGEFELKPPEWRAKDKKLIDIYSTEEGLNKEYDHFDHKKRGEYKGPVASVQYSGNPRALVRFVGRRLESRIVWDHDLPIEPKFSWNDHKIKNPNPQQEADDKDPEKILKHIAEQTGLKFTKAKRKVPVLVISPGE